MKDKVIPKIRIARSTNNFHDILKFYRDGLALQVLGEFKNHQGFDGIMLGVKGAIYHFEFTKKGGHVSHHSPSEDQLIVFYFPVHDEYQLAICRMKDAGFNPVSAFNPYWDLHGTTFEDSEGYRIVFCCREAIDF
jgi:hypothetical protein